MFYYLTVRSDEPYTEFTDTAALLEFLSTFAEFKQAGTLSFGSSEPWVSIHLIIADSRGNYPSSVWEGHDDSWVPPRVNVVELHCGYAADPEWCERLAARIADFLQWKVFENDDECQIYPPV